MNQVEAAVSFFLELWRLSLSAGTAPMLSGAILATTLSSHCGPPLLDFEIYWEVGTQTKRG
jgi:hypothetical protein